MNETNTSPNDLQIEEPMKKKTVADFTGAPQPKVFISEEGKRYADGEIAKQKVPTLEGVMQGVRWRDAAAQDRLEKSILQISFLITVDEDVLLVTRCPQWGRNLACVDTEQGSILISHSPAENSFPCKLKHFMSILNGLLPLDDKTYGLGIYPSLRFLGLVKNEVYKKGEQSATTYYFYVFHASFSRKDLLKPGEDLKEKINNAVSHAPHNRADQAITLCPVNEDLIRRIPPDYHADLAALSLYLKRKGDDNLACQVQARTAAIGILSDGALPVNRLGTRFFVSHKTEEYEKLVEPLINKVIEKLKKQRGEKARTKDISSPEPELSSPFVTHEKDVSLGDNWEEETFKMIKFCRGFVAIETSAYFNESDQIITEVAEAVRAAKDRINYCIIRLRYDEISSDDEKKFESRLKETLKKLSLPKSGADSPLTEADADIYLKKAHLPLYAAKDQLLEVAAKRIAEELGK